MSNITVTADQVAPVFTKFGKAEIYDVVAYEALTAGEPVYILEHATTGGTVGVATAAAANGLEQFRGIALSGVGAGQAVSILVHGCIYGYTLTDLEYDAILYLSDTAGSIADAAGTVCVEVGRVWPLSDADRTKVLLVDVNMGIPEHAGGS